MSQKGSSIVSSDNPQLKYKKALMEIQKIHKANLVLKGESEEMKTEYQRQINQLSLSLEHVSKEYDNVKNDKAELQKFLEELQVSNSELRKEYNNLEREVTYLNDVLTEQNTELKKVNAFKDQKGLSALITSYQDREINYRKDIARQEELLRNVKTSCQTLEAELAEERRQRFKLEDLNGNLKMEISRYRELNNTLLSKNQNIVASLLNRSSESKEKYREAESVLGELGRQLELVKAARVEQQTVVRSTVSLDSYQGLLQQKGKIQGEVARMRERLTQYEIRSKEIFEMQQKMKKAVLRSEQLQEESNMLKSKLIMMETKDLMEGGQDIELKQFEQKVIANIGQNDPLSAIKNSADSSHFQLMKTYVIELKEKLSKSLTDKRDLQKKYRSMKQKLGDRAQKAIGLEEQNKLLKGKLQGFERLSERLQFQLQRSMEVHEQEMSKMKSITNSILNKKSEQTKIANAFIRAQLDLELDKFQKTQKGLRQEIETVKLQVSMQKIKNADLQDKLTQANQFLAIYKAKFTQIHAQNQQTEQNNHQLTENATRYEQLYREEKSKNQAFLAQKQALTSRLTQLTEQIQKKQQLEDHGRVKDNTAEAELRRVKAELGHARGQIQQIQIQLRNYKLQAEEKIKSPGDSTSRSESGYYSSLEQNYAQQREKNRQLQAEFQTMKLRFDRSVTQSQRVNIVQDALSSKNDQINDLKRKNITLQKQIGVYQAQLRQSRLQYDNLKKQNNTLKAKLLDSGQQVRKLYESKDLQNKRTVQKLNEDLASSTSELREEKRAGARLQIEVQSYKSQIQRLQQFIEQSRRKESSFYQELGQLRTSYESSCEEAERLKSQIRYKNGVYEGLNSDIANLQDRNFKLGQENSQLRVKVQSNQNDLSEVRRDLGGLKVYLTEVEEYVNAKVGGNWQEQRDRDNLNNFLQRVKRILRTSQVAQQQIQNQQAVASQQTQQYRSPAVNSTPTGLPDYFKRYSAGYDSQPYPASQAQPFKSNYDNQQMNNYDNQQMNNYDNQQMNYNYVNQIVDQTGYDLPTFQAASEDSPYTQNYGDGSFKYNDFK